MGSLAHLGNVPKVDSKALENGNLAKLVQENPHSKFAEMIRNIRVSIDFSINKLEDKSLLITSALPEEGKSIFSTNLSLAYAQDGQKVLLVDADLRRPSLRKNLGLGDNENELLHFLTGQKEFDDVIYPTAVENLSVSLTRTVAPNPVEVLNSGRMSHFLSLAAKAAPAASGTFKKSRRFVLTRLPAACLSFDLFASLIVPSPRVDDVPTEC